MRISILIQFFVIIGVKKKNAEMLAAYLTHQLKNSKHFLFNSSMCSSKVETNTGRGQKENKQNNQ